MRRFHSAVLAMSVLSMAACVDPGADDPEQQSSADSVTSKKIVRHLVAQQLAPSAKPAAVPGSCHSIVDNDGICFLETSDDGQLVWGSCNEYQIPTPPACDRPYLGHSSECGSYRFVVDTETGDEIQGAWFRSCDTPQPGASSLVGWIRAGNFFHIEQKLDDAQFNTFATHFTIYD